METLYHVIADTYTMVRRPSLHLTGKDAPRLWLRTDVAREDDPIATASEGDLDRLPEINRRAVTFVEQHQVGLALVERRLELVRCDPHDLERLVVAEDVFLWLDPAHEIIERRLAVNQISDVLGVHVPVIVK